MYDECCPRFDPKPWDEVTLSWQGKRFVKGRVSSFLHFPMNYGAVMKRMTGAIAAANARPESMAIISGTFLSKVFEGPYRNMRSWIEEMKAFVQGKGESLRRMFFFYTTCPKCAKKYRKNYVAILAQVAD
jgi:hypothetical protein